MIRTKAEKIQRRHQRLRKKVSGTGERPRLFVRKTLRHLHVQVFDDTAEGGARCLLTLSTVSKENANKQCCNIASAKKLGADVGAALLARGITKIVYDRGGYQYHGIVKALAEAIRETKVQF